jgi:hypothetical protein
MSLPSMSTLLITPSQLSLFSISPVIGAWLLELEARKLFEDSKPAAVSWISSCSPMPCATSRCCSPSWRKKATALPGCQASKPKPITPPPRLRWPSVLTSSIRPRCARTECAADQVIKDFANSLLRSNRHTHHRQPRRRDLTLQPPADCHRALTLVFLVEGKAQAGKTAQSSGIKGALDICFNQSFSSGSHAKTQQAFVPRLINVL